MFKTLDIWMEELEQELYSDYMRALNALIDWCSGKQFAKRTVELRDIRDDLQGDYRSYSCYRLTDKYKEVVFDHNDKTWCALIDTYSVCGVDFDEVVIVTHLKDSINRGYDDEYRAETFFKKKVSDESGFNHFLERKNVYACDVTLVNGRDAEWIKTRAHKDMLAHKKSIESKIQKICEEIDSIAEDFGEVYVKGTNGRFAHIWRIVAGGYNIQRKHTRCLCKEVKKIPDEYSC